MTKLPQLAKTNPTGPKSFANTYTQIRKMPVITTIRYLYRSTSDEGIDAKEALMRKLYLIFKDSFRAEIW